MLMGAYQDTTRAGRRDMEARAWQFALRIEAFGYAEIADELAISMDLVTNMVRGWQDAGRVRLKRPGGTSGPKLFELSPEYAEKTDRSSVVIQQLWTAMRGLRSFSAVDLVAHSRADLKVELREASAYCQSLLKAGYLRVTRTAVPGKRDAGYLLVQNSGPRAPRVRRISALWDPNESAYTHVPGAVIQKARVR